MSLHGKEKLTPSPAPVWLPPSPPPSLAVPGGGTVWLEDDTGRWGFLALSPTFPVHFYISDSDPGWPPWGLTPLSAPGRSNVMPALLHMQLLCRISSVSLATMVNMMVFAMMVAPAADHFTADARLVFENCVKSSGCAISLMRRRSEELFNKSTKNLPAV